MGNCFGQQYLLIRPGKGLRIWHLAEYVQDDIKITPHLTLNFGIRNEFSSAPYEIESRLGGVANTGPLFGHFVLNPQPIYPSQRVNLSPRFGAAYELNRKTVLRGGFAELSNIIPTVYPDQAATEFPIAAESTITNPTYSLTPLQVSLPALTSTTGAVMPPNGNTKSIPGNTPVNLAPIAALLGSIVGVWPSNKLKNGTTLTGNFTIEQQLPVDMALQATYITNHALDLYSPNYPNASTGAQSQYSPFTNTTPGLGEFQLQGNSAISHCNALQVQLRKNSPLYGLQYQASYTWSNLLTDADDLWSASGQNGGISQNNPSCIKCEYARASYDVKQRFVANFSYTIPGIWGRVPQRISHGWAVFGIFNAQSGFPLNITGPYGTQQYGFDTLNGLGARPNFIKIATKNTPGSPQYFSDSVVANNGLNGNYFGIPTVPNTVFCTVQTEPGNLGRNTYTGPGWWNFDTSLTKDTRLMENVMVQFRPEFFNSPPGGLSPRSAGWFEG